MSDLVFKQDKVPTNLYGRREAALEQVQRYYRCDSYQAKTLFDELVKVGIIKSERDDIFGTIIYRYNDLFDWGAYDTANHTKHRYLVACTNSPIDYNRDFQCIVEWNKLELDDLIKTIQEEFKKKYPEATPGIILIRNLIEIGYPDQQNLMYKTRYKQNQSDPWLEFSTDNLEEFLFFVYQLRDFYKCIYEIDA